MNLVANENGIDWKNLFAYGMFADGSTSNGTSYGAWTVMNNKVRSCGYHFFAITC